MAAPSIIPPQAGDVAGVAARGASELDEALNDVAVILSEVGQGRYAEGFYSLLDALRDAHDDRAGEQAVVRLMLRLYGGMGSFQDLVLQDSQGVRPEQDEFDRARTRLFDAARSALR